MGYTAYVDARDTKELSKNLHPKLELAMKALTTMWKAGELDKIYQCGPLQASGLQTA
jgi:hypothetical protein